MVTTSTFQLKVNNVSLGSSAFTFKADFLPPDEISGKHCHMKLVGAASHTVAGKIQFAATLNNTTFTTTTAHLLQPGDSVVVTSGSGLTLGKTYYVLTIPTSTTLTMSDTAYGTAVQGIATGNFQVSVNNWTGKAQHCMLFVTSLIQPRGTIAQSTSTEIYNQNPSKLLGMFSINGETTDTNTGRVLTYIPEGQVQLEFTIQIVSGCRIMNDSVFYLLIEFE